MEMRYRHFLRDTEENHENFSQDSRCPSRDSNQAPPGCSLKRVGSIRLFVTSVLGCVFTCQQYRHRRAAATIQSQKTCGQAEICMISGFFRDVDFICPLLDYNAVCSGNFLATFRDNLSVPFQGSHPLRWDRYVLPKRR